VRLRQRIAAARAVSQHQFDAEPQHQFEAGHIAGGALVRKPE